MTNIYYTYNIAAVSTFFRAVLLPIHPSVRPAHPQKPRSSSPFPTGRSNVGGGFLSGDFSFVSLVVGFQFFRGFFHLGDVIVPSPPVHRRSFSLRNVSKKTQTKFFGEEGREVTISRSFRSVGREKKIARATITSRQNHEKKKPKRGDNINEAPYTCAHQRRYEKRRKDSRKRQTKNTTKRTAKKPKAKSQKQPNKKNKTNETNKKQP